MSTSYMIAQHGFTTATVSIVSSLVSKSYFTTYCNIAEKITEHIRFIEICLPKACQR